MPSQCPNKGEVEGRHTERRRLCDCRAEMGVVTSQKMPLLHSYFSVAKMAQMANSGIGSTKDLGRISLTSYLYKSLSTFPFLIS